LLCTKTLAVLMVTALGTACGSVILLVAAPHVKVRRLNSNEPFKHTAASFPVA